MWLFDNIFLDQNTPTSVLDTPKEEDQTWWEVLTNAPTISEPISSTVENPIHTPASAWKNTELPKFQVEEIAPMPEANTNNSIAPTDVDISFDIGGDLDMFTPWAAENRGEALTSDAAPTEITDAASLIISNTTPIDASVALVQSATAVWGMMIIDDEPVINITSPEWSGTIPMDTPAFTIEPEITMIEAPQKEETSITHEKVEEGAIVTSTRTEDGGGLFGFMNTESSDSMQTTESSSEVDQSISVETTNRENQSEGVLTWSDGILQMIPSWKEVWIIQESHIMWVNEKKVDTMVGGFIEELERERQHLREIDELYTFRVQENERKKAALRERYEQDMNLLEEEGRKIFEEKNGKNTELQRLDTLIATLEKQAQG